MVKDQADLGAGRSLLENPEFAAQAAFFAQKVVEKSIKGFLLWHQERFKKDHDIRYLGSLVLKKEESLKPLLDEAVTLNPYAVTFRYPGDQELPSLEEASDALSVAEKLLNEILKKLPSSVHP